MLSVSMRRYCVHAPVIALTATVAFLWCAGRATGTPPARVAPLVGPAEGEVALVARGMVAAAERHAPESVRGYYAAPTGTVLVMALRATQESEVRMQQAQETAAFAMTSEGRLRLTVVGRRPGRVMVGVAFPEIDLRIRAAGVSSDSAECAEVERLMGEEATMLTTDDGEVLGWRFAADVPPHVRTLVRGLVSLVRFVGSDAKNGAWSTVESDPAGEYRVDYRRLPDSDGQWRVRRTRSALTPHAFSGANAAVTVSDTAEAQFDPALGWLVAATCKESVETRDEATAVQVRASSSVTLKLEETSTRVVDVAPAWDAAWESASSADDCRADDLVRQRTRDEALVAGASAEELLLEVRRCTRGGGVEATELLHARSRVEAAVRLNAGTCQTIRTMLLDGSLDDEAIGVALSAAGASATTEAQFLLASVAMDKTLAPMTREYALLALFQVAEPGSDTRSAVRRLWDDVLDDAKLRSTALLLLGAQARGSDARFQELLSLAPTDSDPMLATFLEAIGNAGHLEALEAYRTHSHQPVREVAERILARKRA